MVFSLRSVIFHFYACIHAKTTVGKTVGNTVGRTVGRILPTVCLRSGSYHCIHIQKYFECEFNDTTLTVGRSDYGPDLRIAVVNL